MILDTLRVAPAVFTARTGWTPKPEGLCKGDVCVPAPGAVGDDGLLDVQAVADRLRMPLVHDQAHDLWALGPESGGTALTTVEVPELDLVDRKGDRFDFTSLRGRRVVMVAWASW